MSVLKHFLLGRRGLIVHQERYRLSDSNNMAWHRLVSTPVVVSSVFGSLRFARGGVVVVSVFGSLRFARGVVVVGSVDCIVLYFTFYFQYFNNVYLVSSIWSYQCFMISAWLLACWRTWQNRPQRNNRKCYSGGRLYLWKYLSILL